MQLRASQRRPLLLMRYDRARRNLDRHLNYILNHILNHILAAYMASGT